MDTHNPNITLEGNFTLTYFPNTEPHTPVEEAIQFLYDFYNHKGECSMQSPLVKERMTDKINHVLLPACKEGNQDATHWMFVAYVNGLGVEQDEDKSLEYLKILAECGCPDMQCEFGKWYETVDCGTCKEEMNREAVKWFAKAAERGHEEAKAELEFYNRRESEKAFEEDGFLPCSMFGYQNDPPF